MRLIQESVKWRREDEFRAPGWVVILLMLSAGVVGAILAGWLAYGEGVGNGFEKGYLYAKDQRCRP